MEENDVFQKDIVADEQTSVRTSEITSFLNEEFIINSVNTEDCFHLNFPLNYTYNTGQEVSIGNYDGLEQAAKSQSTNFHINSICLPFSAINNGEELKIETLKDFNAVFNICQIPTLKNSILEKINFCFNFQYPITLFNDSSNEEIIIDDNELYIFLDEQESNYVPKFIFPVHLNGNILINNYFDFYKVMNNCGAKMCSDVIIYTEEIAPHTYSIELQSEANTLSNFEWHINDELQSDITSSKFEHQFTTSGTYNICGKAITDNCTALQTDCKIIEISINGLQ